MHFFPMICQNALIDQSGVDHVIPHSRERLQCKHFRGEQQWRCSFKLSSPTKGQTERKKCLSTAGVQTNKEQGVVFCGVCEGQPNLSRHIAAAMLCLEPARHACTHCSSTKQINQRNGFLNPATRRRCNK